MSEAYRRAGVDLDAAAEAVRRISEIASGASRPEVRAGVGGFAGLYDLGDGRLLAAATDGVGTKLEIARAMGRLDTVGIDLVAMCANDIACTGARPLFFLDYLAVGRLVPADAAAIVGGIAEGCRAAGCALLGGETAEHPGVMEDGQFDLAGFCVGVLDEADLLGPHRVREGDALVALPSTGAHANGFSLIRRVLADAGASLEAPAPPLDRPLGQALLEPTAIYVEAVAAAAATGRLHAAAHITGGGLPENVPRILPEGLGAQLEAGAWEVPPVLEAIARLGDLAEDDLRSTFNLGIGMVLVTDDPSAVAAATGGAVVGAVTAGEGVRW